MSNPSLAEYAELVNAMLAAKDAQIRRLEADLLAARKNESHLEEQMEDANGRCSLLRQSLEASHEVQEKQIKEIKDIRFELRERESQLSAIVREWRSRPKSLAACQCCGGVASLLVPACGHILCASKKCSSASCDSCLMSIDYPDKCDEHEATGCGVKGCVVRLSGYQPMPGSADAVSLLGEMSAVLLQADRSMPEVLDDEMEALLNLCK
ncbi:hypothetical protein BD626DRAFT_566290 [Schizophyllum amplum]|uniref:Uncharacterized protein n=1 Tax=Schizophyllum amplum TaxID=97359 RepID=A0A550CR64_9AGAR|nr:hypothetical protein BD626DRAFT_566290 [Auriculariopsis ampla]